MGLVFLISKLCITKTSLANKWTRKKYLLAVIQLYKCGSKYIFTYHFTYKFAFFSGLIPSNYIEMRPHSWYYGRITRADAEKLLMNKVRIWKFEIFQKNSNVPNIWEIWEILTSNPRFNLIFLTFHENSNQGREITVLLHFQDFREFEPHARNFFFHKSDLK